MQGQCGACQWAPSSEFHLPSLVTGIHDAGLSESRWGLWTPRPGGLPITRSSVLARAPAPQSDSSDPVACDWQRVDGSASGRRQRCRPLMCERPGAVGCQWDPALTGGRGDGRSNPKDRPGLDARRAVRRPGVPPGDPCPLELKDRSPPLSCVAPDLARAGVNAGGRMTMSLRVGILGPCRSE